MAETWSDTTKGQRERLVEALEALAAEADELVDECLSYRRIGEDNPHVVLVQREIEAARNLLAAADLLSDGGHATTGERKPDGEGWQKVEKWRRPVDCPCGYIAWEYSDMRRRTICTKCGGQEIGSPVQPTTEGEGTSHGG